MSASKYKFKAGDIVLIKHRIIDDLVHLPNEYVLIVGVDIDKGGPYYITQDVLTGERHEESVQYLEHESTELVA